MNEWANVLAEPDVNKKTELYQDEVVGAIEACFPLKKARKKTTDPP